MPKPISVVPTSMSKRPAIFFDRDGTLIYDRSYMSKPEQVELLPGAIELLALLSSYGHFTVVVSNQSGVGRGLMTEQEAAAVHSRFEELLATAGVSVGATLYCPHAPEDDCECRKPRPGLLLRAAAEHELDLSSSFMVGDKESDWEAGVAAGCTPILLASEEQPPSVAKDSDSMVSDLTELKLLFEKLLVPDLSYAN
ncbi:MAG: gmhB [Bryobacterales bacterium]|nr:gmhB [Bryobacterales bacterium]